MGFIAILTLINQAVNTGGPLAAMAIKAFGEIRGHFNHEDGTQMTDDEIWRVARDKHDVDTGKISTLLEKIAALEAANAPNA